MNIWYVSKYANISKELPTRHFFISKYLIKQGHNVKLIFSRSNGIKSDSFFLISQSKECESVDCVKLNGPTIKLGFNLKRITSWVIFEFNLLIYSIVKGFFKKPDIIIVSSLSLLTFFTGSLLKKIFSCKLVVEVRDIWPDTIIDSGKFSTKSLFVKFLRKVEYMGYKNADGIISTLPKFDLYLKQKGFVNFKFKHIPQGFDPDLLSDNKIIKPNNKKFTICYAGSIGKVNYINEILDVAKELEYINSIYFIIIGNGPLKKELINKYGYLKNVSFLNQIYKEDVVPFLSNCDLLVNMWGNHKIYEYGVSPNKWIDYMLSGRPMLISYSGYKSIINDANCGFFTEANNIEMMKYEIIRISNLPKYILDETGNNGKKYALKYLNYNYLSIELNDFFKII